MQSIVQTKSIFFFFLLFLLFFTEQSFSVTTDKELISLIGSLPRFEVNNWHTSTIPVTTFHMDSSQSGDAMLNAKKDWKAFVPASSREPDSYFSIAIRVSKSEFESGNIKKINIVAWPTKANLKDAAGNILGPHPYHFNYSGGHVQAAIIIHNKFPASAEEYIYLGGGVIVDPSNDYAAERLETWASLNGKDGALEVEQLEKLKNIISVTFNIQVPDDLSSISDNDWTDIDWENIDPSAEAVNWENLMQDDKQEQVIFSILDAYEKRKDTLLADIFSRLSPAARQQIYRSSVDSLGAWNDAWEIMEKRVGSFGNKRLKNWKEAFHSIFQASLTNGGEAIVPPQDVVSLINSVTDGHEELGFDMLKRGALYPTNENELSQWTEVFFGGPTRLNTELLARVMNTDEDQLFRKFVLVIRDGMIKTNLEVKSNIINVLKNDNIIDQDKLVKYILNERMMARHSAEVLHAVRQENATKFQYVLDRVESHNTNLKFEIEKLLEAHSGPELGSCKCFPCF